MPSPSTTGSPDPGRPDCHECGATVSPDANFCSACGADLADGTEAQFCGSCGSRFGSDDAFCSECGAERDGGGSESPARHEAVSAAGSASDTADTTLDTDESTPDTDESAFRRRVQQHLDAGWEIERDEGDTVVLVDRDIGSIPIHVLLLFTTGGVGNFLYGYYHHSMLAETRRLTVDEEDYPMPKREPDEETALMTASAYGLSAVVLLVGSFIAITAAQNGSVAMAGVGLALAVAGLAVAPPADDRLGRRHRITAFGRQKTVDHRVLEPVDPCEEPCVVCDERFDGGVVRRRRDETLFAGVPVRTHEHELNHYCAACARAELFGTTGPAAPADRVKTSLADAVNPENGDTDPENGDTDAETDETHVASDHTGASGATETTAANDG